MSHERSVALIDVSFMVCVCFLVSVLLPDRFVEWCLNCDIRRHSDWLLNTINLCSLPWHFPQLVFVSLVVMHINLSLSFSFSALFGFPLPYPWYTAGYRVFLKWCSFLVCLLHGLLQHVLAGLAFWLPLRCSSTLLASCYEVFLPVRCASPAKFPTSLLLQAKPLTFSISQCFWGVFYRGKWMLCRLLVCPEALCCPFHAP